MRIKRQNPDSPTGSSERRYIQFNEYGVIPIVTSSLLPQLTGGELLFSSQPSYTNGMTMQPVKSSLSPPHHSTYDYYLNCCRSGDPKLGKAKNGGEIGVSVSSRSSWGQVSNNQRSTDINESWIIYCDGGTINMRRNHDSGKCSLASTGK